MGLVTGSGLAVVTGPRLAAGGQGEIFTVPAQPGTVFKKYLPRTLASDQSLERRLQVMTARRPETWREDRSGHLTLAWPTDLVREDGRFTGFLMPTVDMERTVGLHRITNPTDRRSATGPTSWARSFTWRYLVRTAANLARATAGLHRAGVVIGDFNDSNIRAWREARVTLLDCDSMQIRDSDTGERFFCRVGRPEFTPPELAGANWATTVRHPSSDLFALAIHLYQLLLEGEHPFRGVWHGTGDKPTVSELASQGIWAHHGSGPLTPRRAAISVTLLPPDILGLFRQAFEDGAADPVARPTAAAWHDALEALDAQLVTCSADSAHIYPGTHESCPWCQYTPPPPLVLQQPRTRTPAERNGGSPAPGGSQVPGGTPAPAQPGPGRRLTAWLAVLVILIVVGIIVGVHLAQSPGTPALPVVGPPPSRTLNGQGLGLTTVAFSPSGTTLATGDQMGELTLFDVANGHTLPGLAAPDTNQADAHIPKVSAVASVPRSPGGRTRPQARTAKMPRAGALSRG